MVTVEERRRIQELLKDIWSEFKRVGTTDEWEIVETLAERLVAGQAEAMPENVRPRTSRNRYALEKDIIPWLDQASMLAGGKDILFDRYMLFYASLTTKRGDYHYPLPRHLVDFMLNLLRVRPIDSFADFTCGTGGFLVNRDGGKNLQQELTLGIEISAKAARLAGANAMLHGMTEAHTRLHIGDALKICLAEDTMSSTREEVRPATFDRIAMAPPFGLTIDTVLAKKWTGRESGRKSENIFTRLALAMLKDDGWAALLVPTGLTHGETNALPALRRLLLQQCTLHAVISLEEGMLEPFGSERASILLFQKTLPSAEHQPWFFRLEKDGYPSSRGRNLLMEPAYAPGENDFPLVEQALLLTDSNFLPASNVSGFAVATLSIQSPEQQYGIVIKTSNDVVIRSVRHFYVESRATDSNYLLVDAQRASAGPTYSVMCIDAARVQVDVETFNNSQEAFQRLRTLVQTESIQDIQQGITIFRGEQPGQRIAIRRDGHVTGITQQRLVLERDNWELQPARYVPLPDEVPDIGPLATVLIKIQRSQRIVTRYIDSLAGQLEVRPIVGAVLPPPVYPVEHVNMLKALGQEQRAIWDIILKYVGVEEYALYFTPEHVQQRLQQKDAASEVLSRTYIQQALDLLERMGLIVRVLVAARQGGRPLSYYRRATALDMTDLQAESEDL